MVPCYGAQVQHGNADFLGQGDASASNASEGIGIVE